MKKTISAITVLLIFISSFSSTTLSFDDPQKTVYVWDFTIKSDTTDKTEIEKNNKFADELTEGFQTALIKSRLFKVVERRKLASIKEQLKNEEKIKSIEGISSATLAELKTLEANAVIFGVIQDSQNSGDMFVTINVTTLETKEILWSDYIIFSRGERNVKKDYMREMELLVNSLKNQVQPNPSLASTPSPTPSPMISPTPSPASLILPTSTPTPKTFLTLKKNLLFNSTPTLLKLDYTLDERILLNAELQYDVYYSWLFVGVLYDIPDFVCCNLNLGKSDVGSFIEPALIWDIEQNQETRFSVELRYKKYDIIEAERPPTIASCQILLEDDYVKNLLFDFGLIYKESDWTNHAVILRETDFLAKAKWSIIYNWQIYGEVIIPTDIGKNEYYYGCIYNF